MRLRDLPRPAKLLVGGMYLLGAAGAAACFLLPPPQDVVSAAVFILLSFLVASKRVKIHPHVASISLGFVLVFVALFRCGTIVAMATAVVNSLGCYVLSGDPKRKPSLLSVGYNAASLAVAAFAAGVLRHHVLEYTAEAGLPWPELWGAIAVVFAYHGLSVLALGLISALSGPDLDIRRWWRELLATAPIYYAGGAMAFALDHAISTIGRWVFVVGLPFAYVIHRAYKVQADNARNERRLLEERAKASEKMARMYLSVVEALSNAIDMKDHGTLQHVQRVHRLARSVAEHLGITGNDLEAVKIGAVLHDIGKLAVPDHILRKPGRLTEEEFQVVKQHAAAGAEILRPIDFGVQVCNLIRHHHEKLDGSGYPDGLAGDEISLGARVLAVIDVYDALVSDRPYRRAWSNEMALRYLRAEAGKSFDPRVVEALAEAVENGCADACSDAAPLPSVLAIPGSSDPKIGDKLLAAQVQQSTRRTALQGLVRFIAQRYPVLAVVAYEVASSAGELDAVAEAGPYADVFHLLRLSMGYGISGLAAQTGVAETGAISDELSCLSSAPPEKLNHGQVTAIPIHDAEGSAIAVLSLYHASSVPHAMFATDDTLLATISLVAYQLAIPDEHAMAPSLPMTVVEAAAGGE